MDLTPQVALSSAMAAVMCLSAAPVQSALGSTTPPALREKSSTSTGINTTVSFAVIPANPGATFLLTGCAQAPALPSAITSINREIKAFMGTTKKFRMF
ncbi:MAG: hypothetical protein FJ333_11155 [Sphingomonadales bacterium]|nr:hypothetical protein [Sphingomonadales bacterium]